MKLLIITQKVNRKDPVLGFFHRWLTEFAKHFESIVVICLEKGEYDLPPNVKILSLGKEQKQSRRQYLWRFFTYVWQERKNYDAVFSHMNQEYILLAGWLWKILGKRIYMWRNHYAGDELTDMAAVFCRRIFCTSRHSYTAKYKKTTLMPVGIDMEIFKTNQSVDRAPRSVLSLGRISPSKNVHVLIEALGILAKEKTAFTASLYGDATAKDSDYLDTLRQRVTELGLDGKITFHAGVPNEKTIDIYSAHDVFVNLSPSGMYDKTIFESMACGCRVLVSNKDIVGEIDAKYTFAQDDVDDLARKLRALLATSGSDPSLREYALAKHSLTSLAAALESAIIR